MKRVIDIDEDLYKAIKNNDFNMYNGRIYEMIRNSKLFKQASCVVQTKHLSDDEIKKFVEAMKNVRVQVIPREPCEVTDIGMPGTDEVLDEIKAEIKAMSGDIETIAEVLQIIDKYRN